MTGRARFTLLDPLRILASFGVVWHHTREGWFLGVAFGLFLFFAMMLALVVASTRKESPLALGRRRASGLLAPWLRWCAVFFVALAAVDLWRGEPPLARYSERNLLAGTSFHLWFLPFALVALVAVRATAGSFARWPLAARVVFFSGLAFLAATWSAFMNHRHWTPPPVMCWIGAVPSVPLGVALGLALRADGEGRRRALLASVVGVGAVAAVTSPAWGLGHDEVRRYLVATTLAAVGFAWSPRVPARVERLAATTFGIYLVHPLVVEGLELVTRPDTWPPAAHVTAVWGLSSLLVAFLARLPFQWAETARLRAGRSSPGRAQPMGESEASLG